MLLSALHWGSCLLMSFCLLLLNLLLLYLWFGFGSGSSSSARPGSIKGAIPVASSCCKFPSRKAKTEVREERKHSFAGTIPSLSYSSLHDAGERA